MRHPITTITGALAAGVLLAAGIFASGADQNLEARLAALDAVIDGETTRMAYDDEITLKQLVRTAIHDAAADTGGAADAVDWRYEMIAEQARFYLHTYASPKRLGAAASRAEMSEEMHDTFVNLFAKPLIEPRDPELIEEQIQRLAVVIRQTLRETEAPLAAASAGDAALRFSRDARRTKNNRYVPRFKKPIPEADLIALKGVLRERLKQVADTFYATQPDRENARNSAGFNFARHAMSEASRAFR